jgi:hypothetical protein
MDWISIVTIVLVVLALVWIIGRLRGNSRNPNKLQMAMDMISALNDDLKMIRQKETAPADFKKFKVVNWKFYQDHLDFLDKDCVEALKSSFDQMSEYNKKLAQMNNNSGNSMPQIDLDNLKSSAVKGRAGLAKWIQENVNREATRSLFSWRN